MVTLSAGGNQKKFITSLRMKSKNRHKVLFVDSVETSCRAILIGGLAKMLKRNEVDAGIKRVSQTIAQENMERSLFEVKAISQQS